MNLENLPNSAAARAVALGQSPMEELDFQNTEQIRNFYYIFQ